MKTLTFLLFSLLLTSCTSTTKSLWENPAYNEKISSFLITENGEKLAIIGKKYHYIFSLENNLKDILISKKRDQLKPVFYSFKADKNNNISGKYTLNYTNKNPDEIAEIKILGFTNRVYGDRKTSTYIFSGALNGQRYTPDKNINANYEFNRSYTIKVEEPSTLTGNTVKALVTPVAVATDGVKTIAGMILIPIYGVVLTNKY